MSGFSSGIEDCANCQATRRHFIASGAMNIASLALAWLLKADGVVAQEPSRPELEQRTFDLKPKAPHQMASARAMVSLVMQGGPSHIDLFDPKPEMAKYDGSKFPREIKYDNAAQASSKVFPSPWRFAQTGQCGTEVSELLPYFSQITDDVTLIRSMVTGVNNHGQSIYALTSRAITSGHCTLA